MCFLGVIKCTVLFTLANVHCPELLKWTPEISLVFNLLCLHFCAIYSQKHRLSAAIMMVKYVPSLRHQQQFRVRLISSLKSLLHVAYCKN
ncbi:hypothetical protein V6Z11_D08G218600 [Gossypium hirsutum]